MLRQGRVNVENQISEIVRQVKDLYPNIAVLSELSNLLRDPNADLVDLEQLIKTEPSLTADVIRISNSTLYARATECMDIRSALSQIGFNDTQKIVSHILARDLCSQDLQAYGMSADLFLGESITVSILMELLAPAARINRSQAATMGTLHNVGRVIINRMVTETENAEFWNGESSVTEWEMASVGFHYGEAGRCFLKQMNFAEESQLVILHHVEPKNAPVPEAMYSLLSYAVKLCKSAGIGLSEPDFEIPDLEQLNPYAELSEVDIQMIAEEANSRYEDISFTLFKNTVPG